MTDGANALLLKDLFVFESQRMCFSVSLPIVNEVMKVHLIKKNAKVYDSLVFAGSALTLHANSC